MPRAQRHTFLRPLSSRLEPVPGGKGPAGGAESGTHVPRPRTRNRDFSEPQFLT